MPKAILLCGVPTSGKSTWVKNHPGYTIISSDNIIENHAKVTGSSYNEVFEDYLVFNRVQSLGKFNKKLNEEWNEVLEILDERIKSSLDNGIFKLPEVEIKYGNKTYMTDLIFADRKEYYFHPNLPNI